MSNLRGHTRALPIVVSFLFSGLLSACSAAAGPEAPLTAVAYSQFDTATVGQSIRPAVRVLREGRPVSGAEVTFAVSGGLGSITGAEAITDGNGVAIVGSWTLSNLAGPNMLTATVGDAIVVFRATGKAGPPVKLVKASGDNQQGTTLTLLAESLVIRLEDRFANPISSAALDVGVATGGGTTDSDGTIETGQDGVATVEWVLGPALGAQTVLIGAYAPNVDGSPATFTAQADLR